ncbi:MAG: glycine zipper 2TM domain-containing protein [Deltaproteobacteria bacterium]|nr:glycine zipper 2TM domain-containing protein [Deltaproteobacteria bacterium]
MKKMIIWIIIGIAGMGLLTSCATPAQRQGVGVGGALGALAGALIDSDNRWRGAVVGGAVGAALGGTVTEISAQASREAAESGKPVAYESADGWQRVEASPMSYDALTKCHKVREKVWQDGKLVKDEVREVCESEKTESTY